MEKIASRDILATRIHEYLPPSEILEIKPSLIDLEARDKYRESRPGDDFSLVLYQNRLVIVPSWHPLNRTPTSSNSVVSATGSIETLTMEPVVSLGTGSQERNILTGNIILLEPRMKRLYERSLPAREIDFSVPREEFRQGIIDLMAVQGKGVLIEKDGKVGIGSIRVTVGLGMGRFGKSALAQEVKVSVESCWANKSFPERAYNGSGLVVSAGPDQRLNKFRGKHSSHYGDAARIGAVSKSVGADEAILFAPYYAHNPNHIDYLSKYENYPKSLEQAMLKLALANGLGAELLAVRKDGAIILAPMDVNRLGGVTADYITQSLAPSLGIPVKESPFSLQQVLDGEIVGLFFAGNAARIAAIGAIKLHDSKEEVLREIYLNVPDTISRLIDRFEDEVSSVIAPSDPSLITSVNLKEGAGARKVLEKAFSAWI